MINKSAQRRLFRKLSSLANEAQRILDKINSGAIVVNSPRDIALVDRVKSSLASKGMVSGEDVHLLQFIEDKSTKSKHKIPSGMQREFTRILKNLKRSGKRKTSLERKVWNLWHHAAIRGFLTPKQEKFLDNLGRLSDFIPQMSWLMKRVSKRDGYVTPWEKKFLKAMYDNILNGYRVSDRQMYAIEDILFKYTDYRR